MMSINKEQEIHESLEWFIEYADTIQQLFTEDVDVAITDRKKVIKKLSSNELNEKVVQVTTIVNDTVEISTNQTTAIEEVSQTIQDLMNVAVEIEEMAKEI